MAMFVPIALAIVLWLALLQKLQAKPWLVQGIAAEPGNSATRYPAKVIGLGVFLAVVTALFTLFAAAYHMRMAVPDWSHLPLPKILWFNTALLALSSIALQWAWSATDRPAPGLIDIRRGLLAGASLALLFVAGQLLAWRQLDANGFFFSCTPASAFFYLFTGLHGLHLVGGLLVLGKTTTKIYRLDLSNRTAAVAPLLLSIKLCAIYWHFLLLIWLAIFALLFLT
ncbi:MAG TPA: cytochrome c oxidase subunit 3 [Spongiibacteraceae bacterium]|nr:cytochrome c oxidase subunit 3 [Spongiibacteraceae bacterium]